VRRSGFAVWLCSVVALAGCSISASSESISKSVSSPFTSSSASSASSSPENAYRADVRDFTAAHVKAGGSAQALRGEIGKLAQKHGITDWERSEDTYRAVGEGLAKAGYKPVEVDAFAKTFTDNAQQVEWIQQGYNSAK
jgi:hypothetical protein